MIIQGTNVPITLTFPVNMDRAKEIEVSLLTEGGQELKHWSRDMLSIDGCIVFCSLTQEETITFPACRCRIEVKWLDEHGRVNFADVIYDRISYRADKTVMGAADGTDHSG